VYDTMSSKYVRCLFWVVNGNRNGNGENEDIGMGDGNRNIYFICRHR